MLVLACFPDHFKDHHIKGVPVFKAMLLPITQRKTCWFAQECLSSLNPICIYVWYIVQGRMVSPPFGPVGGWWCGCFALLAILGGDTILIRRPSTCDTVTYILYTCMYMIYNRAFSLNLKLRLGISTKKFKSSDPTHHSSCELLQ